MSEDPRLLVDALRRLRERDPLLALHAELDYEAGEALGQGGMGYVQRVRDRRLERDAALKLLLDPKDPLVSRRFLFEARITARLEHPGIPPIYELGSTVQGQPFIAMKVIQGETLEERLDALPVEARDRAALKPLIRALVKVCEAIGYAHERGIVHRDLKPANIMLGDHGEVLVLDWGIARDLNQASEVLSTRLDLDPSEIESAGFTLDGAVVGTPGYLSPEQARSEAVTPASDVFALGTILTELLTGELPVTGSTPTNLLVGILRGRIRGVLELRPEADRELAALAEWALSVEAEDRPEVAELQAELERWLAREDLDCARYSFAERWRRRIQRRPALAVSLGGLAIVSLLILAGLIELAREREQRDRSAALAEAEREARDAAVRATASLVLAWDASRDRQLPELVRERVRDYLAAAGGGFQETLLAARLYAQANLHDDALALLREVPAPDDLNAAFEAHRIDVSRRSSVLTRTPALERLMALAAQSRETLSLREENILAFALALRQFRDGLKTNAEILASLEPRLESPEVLAEMAFLYGFLCRLESDFDGALKGFRLAVRRDSASPDLLVYYGEALMKTEHRADARQVFDAALRIDPQHLGAHAGVAQFYAGSGEVDGLLATTELLEKTLYAQLAESESATLAHRDLISRALDLRHRVLAAEQRGGEDQRTLQLLVKLQPEVFDYWLSYITRLLTRSELDAARASLDRFEARNPDSIYVHVLRAHLLLFSRRISEAVTELDKAEAIEPDAPYVVFERAVLLIASGEREEGFARLMSLRGKPLSGFLFSRVLTLLYGFGAHDEVLSWFESEASTRPSEDLWVALQSARAAGRASRARELVEAVIARRPQHAGARQVRAEMRLDDGAYEAALEDLSVAFGQADASPELLLLRARVHDKLGRGHEAYSDYRAYIRGVTGPMTAARAEAERRFEALAAELGLPGFDD